MYLACHQKHVIEAVRKYARSGARVYYHPFHILSNVRYLHGFIIRTELLLFVNSSFFLSCMVRNDGNPSLVEYFLYALNAFVKSCADDFRGQVCRLGETLFPLMLQMWKKAQPVAKVWNSILKWWMYVCIHANMPKFRFAKLDVWFRPCPVWQRYQTSRSDHSES